MINPSVKKSFILSSCEEVRQICNTLFTQTEITYYNFVRLYDDGSRVTLYSDEAWTSFFLDMCEKYGLIFESGSVPNNKYILWDAEDDVVSSKLISIARDEFNIDHGFTMIDASQGYVDYHYFASERSNRNINNYYINNLSSLHAFSYYFREKSDFLTKKAYLNRINLKAGQSYTREERLVEAVSRSGFLCDMDQFYLKGSYSNISLTAREVESLALKFRGRSLKESGAILGISPRTIETHINKAKIKLRCSTLPEINKILASSGLEDLFNLITSNEVNYEKFKRLGG